MCRLLAAATQVRSACDHSGIRHQLLLQLVRRHHVCNQHTMTAFRLHVGPEMSQPIHRILLLLFLCDNNVQNCQLYSIQLHVPHFKNFFCDNFMLQFKTPSAA